MSWFGRQLAKYLTGDIAIGGSLSVAGAVGGAGLAWVDYTPTLSVKGSSTPTWTSTTIHAAKYIKLGSLLIMRVHATGTTSGTITAYNVSTPMAITGIPGGIPGLHTGSSGTAGINGRLVRADANTLQADNFGASLTAGGARGVSFTAICQV